MARNYKQDGNVLTFTAPGGGVVSGNGYLIGGIFCVAQGDAAAAAEFEGMVVGVWTLAKDDTIAWTEGEVLYWDDATKKVTPTATGNTRIGWAAQAEALAATEGAVRLGDTVAALGTDGLADGSVTTAKLADDAVTDVKLATDAVTTAKILDGAVTFAKQATFVSTEQTGTGAPQNIAHGLGVVPAHVVVTPTDLAPATTGDYTVVEGVHDATNVIVTVTLSKKFKVVAYA